MTFRDNKKWLLAAARAIAVLAALAVLAGRSEAAIITFEGVAPPGTVLNVNPAAPYSEAGFLFTPTNASSAVFDSASPFGGSGNGTDFFGFAGDINPITLTLTAGGGGPFDLAGLEIGRLLFAGTPTVTFTITGTQVGGGTMVATFSGISTFTPVTLNWTNLTQVRFTATDDVGIDNVNVSPAGTAIPEPSSLALFALGAVGLAGAWQRRRSASSTVPPAEPAAAADGGRDTGLSEVNVSQRGC